MNTQLSQLSPYEVAIATVAACLSKAGFTYSSDTGEFERDGIAVELKSPKDYTHVRSAGKTQTLKSALKADERTVMIIGRRTGRKGRLETAHAVFNCTATVAETFLPIATGIEDVLRRLDDAFPSIKGPYVEALGRAMEKIKKFQSCSRN